MTLFASYNNTPVDGDIMSDSFDSTDSFKHADSFSNESKGSRVIESFAELIQNKSTDFIQ